ncbi:MAG: OmpA family protein [Bacteroidota bacterium]
MALGRHEVTITDSKGCTIIGDVEIDENILPLEVSLDAADIECYGSATNMVVNVKGGKAPFDYQWNTTDVSGDSPNNVFAGSYEVTVSDASGQSKVKKIELAEPSQMVAELRKKRPATSETKNDGRATVSVKGGARGYSYRWDSGETESSAKELSIGLHQVVVADANGCEVELNFTIEKRVLPKLTASDLREGQIIRMSRLYFGADSSYIKPESYAVVNEVADFMEDNPFAIIEVMGHTNNLPPPAYCDSLSTVRAKAVADYVINRGVEKERVFYKGYGKRKQRWTNKTADGRAKNQRVEIRIIRLREERSR